MKYLLFISALSALSSHSAFAAKKPALEILCTGDTNYGDTLKMEMTLRGDCEGNEGAKTYFCKADLKLLEEANSLPRNENAPLFTVTPEGRLVFANKLMPRFTRNGAVINIMDQSTPLRKFGNFEVDVSFGGGRTWGLGQCNVAPAYNHQ
jgi:hypothetical protein